MFTPFEHLTATTSAEKLIQQYNELAVGVVEKPVGGPTAVLSIPTLVLALSRERHETTEDSDPMLLLIDMKQAENQVTPNACITFPRARLFSQTSKTTAQKIAQENLGNSIFVERTRLKFKRGMPLGLYKEYFAKIKGSPVAVTSIPTVLSYDRPINSFRFRAHYCFRYGAPTWLTIAEGLALLKQQSLDIPENVLALESLQFATHLANMRKSTEI